MYNINKRNSRNITEINIKLIFLSKRNKWFVHLLQNVQIKIGSQTVGVGSSAAIHFYTGNNPDVTLIDGTEETIYDTKKKIERKNIMKKLFVMLFGFVIAAIITLSVLHNVQPKGNLIKRSEAAIQVMQTIGVNSEIESQENGLYYDNNIISDIDSAGLSQGLLYLAISELNIIHIDENRKIRLEEYTTLKEAVNMIMNCLQDGSNTDENSTMKQAINCGILRLYDSFFSFKGDNFITQDDMKILTNRLYKQKRYKYFSKVSKQEDSGTKIWVLSKDEYRLITYKELLDDNGVVTRAEATEQIMRAIGMTDNIAEYVAYYTYSHLPANDVTDSNEYPQLGFIYAALEEAQIVKTDEKNLFYPDRYITLKEVTNMIVMCLQKEWVDYNDSVKIALKKNILHRFDSFYSQKNDKYITQEDLDILIQRLKHQRRYKYYQDVNQERPNVMDPKTSTQVVSAGKSYFNIDDERMVTYDEFNK